MDLHHINVHSGLFHPSYWPTTARSDNDLCPEDSQYITVRMFRLDFERVSPFIPSLWANPKMGTIMKILNPS